MAEPSGDEEGNPTLSRRVRILQAYSRAIDEMDEPPEQEDSAFEEPYEPSESNSSTRDKAISGNRPRSLTRQRTVSDAMENLVQLDEDMAPFKLINFLLHGGVASTMPYITLYSRQLGLDAAQVGMVCGIRPLLASVVTPLIGWFADRYQFRRVSAILCAASWISFALLVAVVSPPKLAKCKTALGRLQEILPSTGIDIDPSCKALHNPHTPVVESLRRHLFLEKVILPNITTGLKNNCNQDKLESNHSNVLPTAVTSNNTFHNRTGVQNREERTIVEIGDLQNEKVHHSEDADAAMKKAQDGSWLFDTVSLRDAFISAFILAVFAEMMQVPTICMVDVATLDSLGRGEEREGYAWQRAFGATGYVIFSIITVCILAFSNTTVTICGIDVKFADYKVAFVIFAGIMACGAAIVFSIKFKYDNNSTYHFREVLEVLLTVKYGSILLTAFFLACCNGCINTFLLWHLENLGASYTIFILALLTFGISEVAVSFFFPVWVKSRGHTCLVLLGVWIYCFIFIGYALMENPRWVVIIELFHGAAFALTWNPITTYLTGTVSQQYLATMQGLLSGTYHGLGNVIGSVCAGLLVRSNGAVVTFYGFAVMCMVYGILFLVVNRETGLLHDCRKQYEKYETIGHSGN